MRPGERLAALAIVLLAFALRLYRLGDQSLWFDEAGSLDWATHGIAGLTGDFNPPLYYASLGAWVSLTGTSEFALRYLSLLASVLAVPLLIAVVRRVASWPVALGAGLVLATSPFAVYYGQEARMYSLLLAETLLLGWLLPHAMRRDSAAAGYAATAIAGLLTHYFFVVPLALSGLWWLASTLRTGKAAPLRRLAVAHLAVLAACIPWFWHVSQRAITRRDFWRVQLPPDELALDLLRTFAFGEAWLEHFDQSWLIAVGLALGLTGLVWRGSRLAVAGSLAVLAAGWALVAWAPQPIYTARYLIVVLPAFAVVLAGVLGALTAKRRGPVGPAVATGATGAFLVVLVALHAPALQTLYFDSRYQRDDYRLLVERMRPIARPDDSFVFLSGRLDLPFRYYFGGHGRDVLLDDDRRYPPGDRSPALVSLLADERVDRVWLVRSIAAADFINDPAKTVPATFQAAGGQPTADVAVKGLVAVLYEKASWRGRAAAAPLGAEFGGVVRLDAATVERNQQGVTVELFWESVEPISGPLAYSIQVLRGGELLGQHDAQVGGRFADALGTRGGRQRDVAEVSLPASARGLEVAIAVYRPATGERLQTAGDFGFSPNLKRIGAVPEP